MDKILAIDPGTRKFGWAVFTTKGDLIESGQETLDQKLDVNLRLGQIMEVISKLITIYKPTQLAIEEAFYSLNVSSYGKLMMARGIIIALSVKHSMTVHEYPALKIKEVFTGKAQAKKTEIIKIAELIYGLKSLAEDRADAIAIGSTHVSLSNYLSKASTAYNKAGNTQYRRGKSTARNKSRHSSNSERSQWADLLQKR